MAGSADVDFDLPDEAVELVGLAREFARSDLAVAERYLDAVSDPVAAFTSEVYRTWRKQARAIGLHQILLPAAIGGLGLSHQTYYLVMEELAAGGAGLALVMQADSVGVALAALRRETHPVYDRYVEEFAADTEGVHSGAWAITEPDLGSDMYCPGASFGVRAIPTAGGAGYVINGAKSSWCSNGWLADMLVVMVTVDPSAGMDGTGIFLVPADWPGITKGRPIGKVGLRALNQCEISFTGVEVPKEFMIFAPGPRYRPLLMRGFLGPGNLAVAAAALGITQAAYELGLDYARTRRQGGGVISRHQLVAKRLFDAYTSSEAVRLMLRRQAWNLSRGVVDMAGIYAARALACTSASAVTASMLSLHGSYGITTEYPIEKLWRDAQPLQSADGTLDVVSLEGAALLIDPQGAGRNERCGA
ncbi:MAG: acyl-CoA dehydrogenase family protein [Sporichthyaceae bacterium]